MVCKAVYLDILLLLTVIAQYEAKDPCTSHETIGDDSMKNDAIPKPTENFMWTLRPGGWYRYISTEHGVLASTCPTGNQCFTNRQIWTNVSLPACGQQAKIKVFLRTAEGCTNRQNSMLVKNCESFMVYQFFPTPSGVRFCFDASTRLLPSCPTSTPSEYTTTHKASTAQYSTVSEVATSQKASSTESSNLGMSTSVSFQSAKNITSDEVHLNTFNTTTDRGTLRNSAMSSEKVISSSVSVSVTGPLTNSFYSTVTKTSRLQRTGGLPNTTVITLPSESNEVVGYIVGISIFSAVIVVSLIYIVYRSTTAHTVKRSSKDAYEIRYKRNSLQNTKKRFDTHQL